MKTTVAMFLLIIFTGISFSVSAESQNDISVKVDSQNGNYSLTSSSHKWTFEGGTGKRLDDVKSTKAKDAVGFYNSISFKWKSNIDYEGRIRGYLNLPSVIFSCSFPIGRRTERSAVAFSEFTTIPELPHHFSYHNHIFALLEFFLKETSTPWMLFNDNADPFVISPLLISWFP